MKHLVVYINRTLVILLLALGYVVQAQESKFGKVTYNDFLETKNLLDKEAEAIVLLKDKKIEFKYIRGEGFYQFIDVHERILIRDRSGYDWATKEINLKINGKDKDVISGVKGYTFSLMNNAVVQTKMKNSAIFEEDQGRYLKRVKFTLPALTEGSIVDYKYTIKSPFLGNIDNIILQYKIPIKELKFELKIPEYFGVKKYFNPRSSLRYNIAEDKKIKNIQFSGINNRGVNWGGNDRDQNYSSSKVSYYDRVFSINKKEIPALKDEELVDYINNYRAYITWEIMHFKPPQGLSTNFSESWEDVARTIYGIAEFRRSIENTNYFSNTVDAQFAITMNDKSSAISIYNFVKSKVKWNNYLGYIPDKGAKEAFISGSGNVADINLLLVAILKYKGFDASPILLSTMDNGIPLLPTTRGLNYVIAGVNINDNIYLLDATSPNQDFGLLPKRARNWRGKLIKEDASVYWIDLSPKIMTTEKTNLTYVLSAAGGAQGKLETSANGYKISMLRDIIQEYGQEKGLLLRHSKNEEVIYSEIKVSDSNNTFKQKSSFIMPEAMEEIDGRFYLNPKLFLQDLEIPFKSNERNLPIIYDYPFTTTKTMNIMIPENYKIESLPEKARISLESGGGEYKYSIVGDNKRIRIVSQLTINRVAFTKNEYDYLKQIYNLLKTKEDEQIILSKKE